MGYRKPLDLVEPLPRDFSKGGNPPGVNHKSRRNFGYGLRSRSGVKKYLQRFIRMTMLKAVADESLYNFDNLKIANNALMFLNKILADEQLDRLSDAEKALKELQTRSIIPNQDPEPDLEQLERVVRDVLKEG